SEQESAAFLNVMVDPVSNRFKPHVNGQLAADLAAQAGIPRPYPIKLLVIPTGEVHQNNPLALEKLAPILSLLTVADERAGIQVCQELLAIDGLCHTVRIGTFAGTSTTNNVTYSHLLNVPRSNTWPNWGSI